MTRAWATIVLLIASIHAGCSVSGRMYPGPERSPEEIATVRTRSFIWLEEVDGKRIWLHPLLKAYMKPPAQLELLPGRHDIGVSYSRRDPGFVTYSVGLIHVQLDAKAGHDYFVDGDVFSSVPAPGRVAGGHMFLWINDLTAHEFALNNARFVDRAIDMHLRRIHVEQGIEARNKEADRLRDAGYGSVPCLQTRSSAVLTDVGGE